jgi:sortase (surface protein transpeptidase)
MAATKGPDTVAWYKLGTRPGAVGSAVIAGHFGWSKGVAAVFDHVSNLRQGDRLQVVDNGGVTNTFVVRELRKYNENADAGVVFNSTDGRAHLNLITCAGVWDKATGRFPERLVVFADKL